MPIQPVFSTVKLSVAVMWPERTLATRAAPAETPQLPCPTRMRMPPPSSRFFSSRRILMVDSGVSLP